MNYIKKSYSFIKNLFMKSRDNDYTPQLLQSKLLFYFVIFLFIAKIITIGFFIPFPKNIFFADITKINLLNLLNQDRQKLGLNTLTENGVLDKAAYLKAEDMVRKGYFSHQSPEGITPWFWFLQAGYNYKYAGENLAIGFVDSKNVYDAWFDSPGHKENLLNSHYKEVGTAIVSGFGGNNATVVVQLFASPLIAVVPLQNQKAATIKQIQTSEQKIDQTNISNQPQNTETTNSENLRTTDTPVSNISAQKPSGTVTEKVLSQSIEYNLVPDTGTGTKNTMYYRFLNFIVYDYERLIDNIAYGFLALISASLLMNVLINFNIQRGHFIAKSVLLIIILSGIILLNKDMIVQMIPHQITI